MTESRRRPRTHSSPAGRASGEDIPGPAPDDDAFRAGAASGGPAGPGPADSVPAAEAEVDAGTDASWDAYDQTLAAAVRERDRALDKAATRLASVTAGGYLEYDRSVSVALAAFESAWHNWHTARAAQAAAR